MTQHDNVNTNHSGRKLHPVAPWDLNIMERNTPFSSVLLAIVNHVTIAVAFWYTIPQDTGSGFRIK